MKFLLPLAIILFSVICQADLQLSPRWDSVRTKDDDFSQRGTVSANYSHEFKSWKLYLEGFADYESNMEQRQGLRLAPRGYLQEASLEFNWDSLFIKLGRQSMRWSESWVLPSLDIWTGRKFNRLFLDPFAEQLNHSTGVSVSYAGSAFSVDAVVVTEKGMHQLPEPLPQENPSSEASYGLRFKSKTESGIDYALLAAHLPDTGVFGLTLNYAFDLWVPKLEAGTEFKNGHSLGDFVSAGFDIFWESWIFLFQVTAYEQPQAVQDQHQHMVYFSSVWKNEKHEWVTQAFWNPVSEDRFLSMSYAYQLPQDFQIQGFIQNYSGTSPLYAVYETLTDEVLIGLRFQWNQTFNF